MQTSTPSLSDIGARLREMREDRGFSTETLAALVGVDHRILTAIETGVSPLTVDILRRLCPVLGVSAEELLSERTAADSAEEKGCGIQRQKEWICLSDTVAAPEQLTAAADILCKVAKLLDKK